MNNFFVLNRHISEKKGGGNCDFFSIFVSHFFEGGLLLLGEQARLRCASNPGQKTSPVFTQQELQYLCSSIDEKLGTDNKNGTRVCENNEIYLTETRFARFWDEMQKMLVVIENFKYWFRAGVVYVLSPTTVENLLTQQIQILKNASSGNVNAANVLNPTAITTNQHRYHCNLMTQLCSQILKRSRKLTLHILDHIKSKNNFQMGNISFLIK